MVMVMVIGMGMVTGMGMGMGMGMGWDGMVLTSCDSEDIHTEGFNERLYVLATLGECASMFKGNFIL